MDIRAVAQKGIFVASLRPNLTAMSKLSHHFDSGNRFLCPGGKKPAQNSHVLIVLIASWFVSDKGHERCTALFVKVVRIDTGLE